MPVSAKPKRASSKSSSSSRNGSRPVGKKVKSTRAVAGKSSKISRWGNSLGLRIPQEAADRLHLSVGSLVSVEVGDDSITLRPVLARRRWSEQKLLRGVTPEMVGGEIDYGAPRGGEVW